jgi:hypothetical protein
VGYSLGGEWGGELTRKLRELGPFDVGWTDQMWGGRFGGLGGLPCEPSKLCKMSFQFRTLVFILNEEKNPYYFSFIILILEESGMSAFLNVLCIYGSCYFSNT